MSPKRPIVCRVAGRDVQITGSILRTARLRSEYHIKRLENSSSFIQELRESGLRADIFTFLQDINNPTQRCTFEYETEKIAVLPITTYDEWFSKTLYDKPRNMIRKALKSGIDVRVEEFNDSLLHGIKEIYDESPVRQGRKNRHYKKDLETIRSEHATLLERSRFISVYYASEMIGFAKVIFSDEYASFMNFLSKINHRDKAPNNAILAKAVEICADRKVQSLAYAGWGSGVVGGMDKFKTSNGFQCIDVARYYVPLTLRGRLALGAGVHAGVVKRMPVSWIKVAASARKWWNALRFEG